MVLLRIHFVLSHDKIHLKFLSVNAMQFLLHAPLLETIYRLCRYPYLKAFEAKTRFDLHSKAFEGHFFAQIAFSLVLRNCLKLTALYLTYFVELMCS